MLLKSFSFGIIILLIIIVITTFQGDTRLIISYSGYTGLFFLVMAAFFSGTFISPDSRRVDSFTENSEWFHQRTNWSTSLLIIALPNLVTCTLLFYLSQR